MVLCLISTTVFSQSFFIKGNNLVIDKNKTPQSAQENLSDFFKCDKSHCQVNFSQYEIFLNKAQEAYLKKEIEDELSILEKENPQLTLELEELKKTLQNNQKLNGEKISHLKEKLAECENEIMQIETVDSSISQGRLPEDAPKRMQTRYLKAVEAIGQ